MGIALGISQTNTQGASAVLVRQGHAWRVVSVNEAKMPVPKPSAKRGECLGMTQGVRSRMLEVMARIDWSRVGSVEMHTFTYSGKQDDVTPDEVVKDMKALRMRFQRAGCRFVVFRKELQRRGAIHYHLLTPTMPSGFEDEMRRWWHERAGMGQAAHLKHGYDVRRPREVSDDAVKAYLAKYTAKEEEYRVPWVWGRVWGVWFYEGIPWCEIEARLLHPLEEAAVTARLAEETVRRLDQAIGQGEGAGKDVSAMRDFRDAVKSGEIVPKAAKWPAPTLVEFLTQVGGAWGVFRRGCAARSGMQKEMAKAWAREMLREAQAEGGEVY